MAVQGALQRYFCSCFFAKQRTYKLHAEKKQPFIGAEQCLQLCHRSFKVSIYSRSAGKSVLLQQKSRFNLSNFLWTFSTHEKKNFQGLVVFEIWLDFTTLKLVYTARFLSQFWAIFFPFDIRKDALIIRMVLKILTDIHAVSCSLCGVLWGQPNRLACSQSGSEVTGRDMTWKRLVYYFQALAHVTTVHKHIEADQSEKSVLRRSLMVHWSFPSNGSTHEHALWCLICSTAPSIGPYESHVASGPLNWINACHVLSYLSIL